MNNKNSFALLKRPESLLALAPGAIIAIWALIKIFKRDASKTIENVDTSVSMLLQLSQFILTFSVVSTTILFFGAAYAVVKLAKRPSVILENIAGRMIILANFSVLGSILSFFGFLIYMLSGEHIGESTQKICYVLIALSLFFVIGTLLLMLTFVNTLTQSLFKIDEKVDNGYLNDVVLDRTVNDNAHTTDNTNVTNENNDTNKDFTTFEKDNGNTIVVNGVEEDIDDTKREL